MGSSTPSGSDTFSIYIQDYGAPIGLRIASRHPERVQALIVQNGNAYMDGFTPMWEPLFAFAGNRNHETEAPVRGLLTHEAIRWLWTHGMRNPEAVPPEAWTLAAHNLDRPGNRDIQLDIFYDYRLNIPEYETFQHYFRMHQPPTLVTWGKGDEIFGPDGADAYKRDLPNAEVHLLETGHFALEDDSRAHRRQDAPLPAAERRHLPPHGVTRIGHGPPVTARVRETRDPQA